MAKTKKKKINMSPLDSINTPEMNIEQYNADFKGFMDFSEVQRAVLSSIDFCEQLLHAQETNAINMTAADKKSLDAVYAKLKDIQNAK